MASLAAALLGASLGLGLYTFVYARGYSYLTDDPAACANCHIMDEQYDGWVKSSHKTAAVCNDCHTPAAVVPKYATKASNGFWHSFAFTSGWFDEPIQIKPHNLEIAEQACRKCHSPIVESMAGPHQEDATIACVRCHSTVGHR